MKFTETQKELLAMLPEHLQNSKELTDSAKLVLGNIIFLYGMEYAQNNGYVYRTNIKMMEEIGIKSEHTLIGAVRLLELLGYVETKRGKRNEASTYKLLINCSNNLENCSNNCSNNLENCSNNCSNNLENCSNNCSNNSEKCSNNCSNNSEKCSNNCKKCSNEIKTLQNQVLLLQKEIVLLQKEIEILKNCSNNCSNNCKKCSTDIDTDIDKENNNNLSILELKDLGPKVTEDKKENKIKEKVNEMRNAVLNEMEREVKDNEIQTSTPDEKNTNFNEKEPVYGNLTDDLFDEIFGGENEMSDNGTSVMNVQQKINEMTTSTQGNIITSDSDNGENKVQSGKVNCSKTLPNPNPFPSLNEIWKPVVGYEDLYEISNKGNIKRLARWFKTKGQSEQWRKEMILTPTLNEKGYQRVVLFDIDGNRKKYSVHRLVAEAFIPNPNNFPQVNHKDENKTNNFVYINEDGTVNLEKSNLEWCTNQYNVTYSLGKPVIQYTTDGTIVNTFNSISQAVRKTGFSEKTITKSCKGYETPYDYKWKYKAAGCVKNTSMDNLYTSTEKTQPDAKEVAKTQNNAYSIQEWMTEYEKLLLQVENTDIEDVRFNSILDDGIKLFESFPKNKGNYQRAMQDLRYWAASKLDFKKTFKISEQWGKYYRAA